MRALPSLTEGHKAKLKEVVADGHNCTSGDVVSDAEKAAVLVVVY